jgi:hypothetical protein
MQTTTRLMDRPCVVVVTRVDNRTALLEVAVPAGFQYETTPLAAGESLGPARAEEVSA